MATRKRSKKKSKSSITDQLMSGVTRADIIGVILILISVFTLLSLLTGSRGTITGAWIDALVNVFGIGAWAFPLLTGAIGLWLVVHAIERMEDMSWQRPLGIGLLFIAFITAASLMSSAGEGGGWLGDQLVDFLQETIGAGGAWAMITFVLMAGVVFLADRLLVETGLGIRDLFDDWRYRREQRQIPGIQPSAPLPSGAIPWYKTAGERLAAFWDRVRTPPQKTTLVSTGQGSASQKQAESGKVQNEGTASQRPTLTPHIVGKVAKPQPEWTLPELNDMLENWDRTLDNDRLIVEQGLRIQDTLASHGVPVNFEGVNKGPRVTQYLIRPGYIERTVRGEKKRVKVKVSKITSLSNDLALALAAQTVRIEAPIPGTNYVGVEVPNQESNVVGIKDLLESEEYTRREGKLLIALGEDVKGEPIITDLARMPHLLIAGATGSGKSFCINSIIISLLLNKTPDDLRLLLVDPKMVELSIYNGIPHLLAPVVTEVDKASGILFWAVKEMERRYSLLSKVNARDLERYNTYLEKRGEKRLPYIVVVVDEMADLMMAAPEEVEKHICRLAQMARAVGIHLIIATQRPSVDVITGLIKANFPARIAFAVTSGTDSRVILDIPGAERLLGAGDMLFMAPDASKLERLQGSYLTDDEIHRVVRYWKNIRSLEDFPGRQVYDLDDPTSIDSPVVDLEDISVEPGEQTIDGTSTDVTPVDSLPLDDLSQAPLFEQIETMKNEAARDELYDDAVRVVAEANRGSVTLLQRKLRIGYSRASRLVEQLEEAGILGPDLGGNQGREYLGGRDDLGVGDQPEPPVNGDEPDNGNTPQVWF